MRSPARGASKDINHGRAKFGDEAGVASVTFRIPGLRVWHLECLAVPQKLISLSCFGRLAIRPCRVLIPQHDPHPDSQLASYGDALSPDLPD